MAEGSGWGSHRLVIEAPHELARYIAPKGSIAVQGVSLTVNGVAGTRFQVNLIPHTLDVTTLASLAPGARVNLEVDLIARYVARMNEFERSRAVNGRIGGRNDQKCRSPGRRTDPARAIRVEARQRGG